MKALVYHRSAVRYLACRALAHLAPQRFFPALTPLRLRNRPFTCPAGWITLKPRLCGLCGSDLSLLRGTESFLMEPYVSFPCILGHEVVADVHEAPAGSEWRQGDRVVVEPLLHCAVRGLPPCRFCAQGHYNLCENFATGPLPPGSFIGYNRAIGGGAAEFMAAHPSQLLRVPKDLSDEAAVLTDSLASALQAVLDHPPADDGLVVVYGAGILGQHVLRVIRWLKSSATVVVVARHPFQQELALAGGANTVLLSPSRSALGAALGARGLPSTLGGGNLEGGADVVFDCAGTTSSLQNSLVALRARGTYVMIGAAGTVGPLDVSSLWFRELRVTGSSCAARANVDGQTIRTYAKAIEILSSGRYPVAGLLSHTFPLDAYAQAFRAAFDKARHGSTKVALDMRALPR